MPDLNEQKLFNKKFQAIRALEAQIKKSHTYAESLMQAVLREAFSQKDQSEDIQVESDENAHA